MGAREDLERIEGKIDWCVQALKYLLQGGTVAEADPDGYEELEWSTVSQDGNFPFATLDELRGAAQADEDRLHPRPVYKPNTCPHNRQGLDDYGRVVCNRCNSVLAASGVIQDRPSYNAQGMQIIPDPNPPRQREGSETRQEQDAAGTRMPSYRD
jgi:hypothetical protein